MHILLRPGLMKRPRFPNKKSGSEFILDIPGHLATKKKKS